MNLGGGVGLWIRNDINFNIISMKTDEKHCEMQTIIKSDLKLYTINVYLPFLGIWVFFLAH